MLAVSSRTAKGKGKTSDYLLERMLSRAAASVSRQAADGRSLPPTFFIAYSSNAPLVIHNGNIYQSVYQSQSVHAQESEHRLVFSGQEFSLVQAGTLQALEQLYKDVNAQAIHEYKDRYVQSTIKERLASNEEIKKQFANNKILGFILTEMLPYFLVGTEDVEGAITGDDGSAKSEQSYIEELLKDADADYDKLSRQKTREIKEAYDEGERHLEQILGNYYRSHNLTPKKGKPSTLFERLVTGVGMATLRGTAYRLVRNADANPAVIINGTKYALEALDKAASIELQYKELLQQRFQNEALRESREYREMIVKLEAQTNALEKIAGRKTFQHGDFGFIKNDKGSYTVWEQVPQYALKETGAERYYLFQACKVAVDIGYSQGEIVTLSHEPYVLEPENYLHPFVGGGKHPNIASCGFDRGILKKLTPAGRVVKMLSLGKNLLLKGYRPGGRPGHRHPAETRAREISLEEIQRKRILIGNLRAKRRKAGTKGELEYEEENYDDSGDY